MTLLLHLGVIDIPYHENGPRAPMAKITKTKVRPAAKGKALRPRGGKLYGYKGGHVGIRESASGTELNFYGVSEADAASFTSMFQKRLTAASRPPVTTFMVAGWLETKYHVMEVFFELERDAIVKSLESGLAKALRARLMGAPASHDLFGSAMADVQERFKDFLSLGRIESLGVPGVPTKAALDGVNHRMKSGFNKIDKATGKPAARPSFVDTGLYQSSFRAWMEPK